MTAEDMKALLAEAVAPLAARLDAIEAAAKTERPRSSPLERFREQGAVGLWRDKTRPSRIPPLSPGVVERVVAMTLARAPPAASHWTGSAMAKATPRPPM